MRGHNSRAVLGGLIALAVFGGSLSGILGRADGGWYAALDKPWFAPPHGAYVPAWIVAYVALAVAGWRIWIGRGRFRHFLIAIWSVQLVLNWLWAPVFIGLRMPLAACSALALSAAICLYLGLHMRADRLAPRLLVPCAVWIGFTAWLTLRIATLNP